MFTDKIVKAFVISTDAAAARNFYGEVLGFKFLGADDYGLTFEMNNSLLRISLTAKENAAPQKHTVLGWSVPDMDEAVGFLRGKGVQFEKYSFLQQDEKRVWQAPDGTKVAWFKDPNGNVLSIDQQG